MGVRENKVETYFKEQVEEKLDGLSRKWKSPGMDGVPDQIPVYPGSERQTFVEIKTVDGVVSDVQKREQKRLREKGALVFNVFGESGVDYFIHLAKAQHLLHVHLRGEHNLK